jgi:hypothetical protein
VVTSDQSSAVDYRLIVEDPGFGWKASLYDGDGNLLETLRSGGSLDRTLGRVASHIRGETRTP